MVGFDMALRPKRLNRSLLFKVSYNCQKLLRNPINFGIAQGADAGRTAAALGDRPSKRKITTEAQTYLPQREKSADKLWLSDSAPTPAKHSRLDQLPG